MWQVVGHDWAVKLLEHSLAWNHVSHAYLLAGPAQIGKTTLGLALAKALNCSGEPRPCGQCLSCRKIERGIHPDVRLVEPEGDTLKIDQMRQLQHESILAPYEGRWRVYVIPEFERATDEAANCLLKTLEEPPPQVVLILTTADTGALLPTIVSRCQVLSLRPLALGETARALQSACQIPLERAELLARLSEGRIGWAMRACREQDVLKARDSHLDTLGAIPAQSLVERMQVAEKLAQQGDISPLLDAWSSWWRDILLVQNGCQDLITNIDHRDALQTEAVRYTEQASQGFLRTIHRCKTELDGNANVRLALEVLLLDCPRPQAGLRAQ